MTNQNRKQLSTMLAPLREYFQQEYQSRLDRLILFGSQARGEALPTSDIDILIVLQDQCQSDFRELAIILLVNFAM